MNENFSTLMNLIMEKKKMSPEQLSAKSGITLSEIKELSQGKRTPQAYTIKKIAEALGYSYEKLYAAVER